MHQPPHMVSTSSQPIVEMKSESTPESSVIINDAPINRGNHDQHRTTMSHVVANKVALGPDGDAYGRVEAGIATARGSQVDWGELEAEPELGGIGMSQQDGWILIRRFNYLVFRVKAIKARPLPNLDMGIAGQEQNSPEKFQAHLARLYMTVIINLFGFWKHVVRLRSWRERQRTTAFLSAYIVACLADLLAPTLLAFLTVMVVSPRYRSVCFPPAPPSLIDGATGGLQKPPAGVLASETSVTGAPENQKGEAIEMEAYSFTTSVYKLIARITADKDNENNSSGDGPLSGVAKISGKFLDAKSKTDQEGQDAADDRIKEPMKHAIEDFAFQPLVDGFVDFVDNWERFANVLQPSPGVRAHEARMSLTACLILLTLITMILSRDLMVSVLWFCAGLAFFGSPITRRSCSFLDFAYPNWRHSLRIRNTILRGAPTDAQLAISILRAGEQNKSALPPPPISHGPPEAGTAVDAESLARLGATKNQIRDALEPESDHEELDEEVEHRSKPKTLERLMGAVKRTSKRGVHMFHAREQSKADDGDVHARERLDLGKTTGKITAPAGPQRFPARYEGKTGYIYLSTTGPTPCMRWTSHDEVSETAAWVLEIAEIDEISKVDGMSFKTKHFVRWTLDKQAVNGIVMIAKGQRFHLSEVVGRDQLFNRLIAMGSQMWEVC